SASATSIRSRRRRPRTLPPRATSAIRTTLRIGSLASITPSCARRPRSRGDADRVAPACGALRGNHHPSYPDGPPLVPQPRIAFPKVVIPCPAREEITPCLDRGG